jgi:hypothetical protein
MVQISFGHLSPVRDKSQRFQWIRVFGKGSLLVCGCAREKE